MADDIKVGDVVNYVPHKCHMFDHIIRNGSVELPWVLGLKTINPRGAKEEVEELQGVRLTQALSANKRGQLRGELVTVRPNVVLHATVRAVHPPDKDHPNGSVDLDVHSERGFTLHYDGVDIDTELTNPHSCHAVGTPCKHRLLAPDNKPFAASQDNAELVATLRQEVAELRKKLMKEPAKKPE